MFLPVAYFICSTTKITEGVKNFGIVKKQTNKQTKNTHRYCIIKFVQICHKPDTNGIYTWHILLYDLTFQFFDFAKLTNENDKNTSVLIKLPVLPDHETFALANAVEHEFQVVYCYQSFK